MERIIFYVFLKFNQTPFILNKNIVLTYFTRKHTHFTDNFFKNACFQVKNFSSQIMVAFKLQIAFR